MKILSLNLCATYPGRSRHERLKMVRDFVLQEGIDILLLQEGVRSCFVYNTIHKLATMVNGLSYGKTTFGWLFFWEFQVGVISRTGDIGRPFSLGCEVPQTDFLDSLPVLCRRRVAGVRLDGITFLSVHLSSSPKTYEDRKEQFNQLTEWIKGVPRPLVIGGDWNVGPLSPELFSPFIYAARIDAVAPSINGVDKVFTSEGLELLNYKMVLTEGVTDHPGGVYLELQQL